MNGATFKLCFTFSKGKLALAFLWQSRHLRISLSSICQKYYLSFTPVTFEPWIMACCLIKAIVIWNHGIDFITCMTAVLLTHSFDANIIFPIRRHSLRVVNILEWGRIQSIAVFSLFVRCVQPLSCTMTPCIATTQSSPFSGTECQRCSSLIKRFGATSVFHLLWITESRLCTAYNF